MVEVTQFEVDLGELGVALYSEAAYRQLRAATTGKDREVLNLEQVNGGQICVLFNQLNFAVSQGQPKQNRDACGGQLYAACCEALALAVRLTLAKRMEIAERVDAEAKMFHDTVAEAEAFLGRWRRARWLLYREQLIGPPSFLVEQQMLAAGIIDMLIISSVVQQLRSSERREMNRFLEERILPSIYSLIKSRTGAAEEPQAVDQCIVFVERWILMHRSTSHPKGKLNSMTNDEGGTGTGYQTGAGGIADVNDATGVGNQPGADNDSAAVIAGMNQNANAGNLSAFGKPKGDSRGKGSVPQNKAAAGPPCPTCQGHHPDLRTCPTHLARQDSKFKPTPGASCHWSSGGVTCGGQSNFSRHHRAQWVAEHLGPQLAQPKGGKGKGKGKGKRSKTFAGKGRGRVSVLCEERTPSRK